MKKKIMAIENAEVGEASTSTPKKTGGRKPKASIDADEADNAGEEEEFQTDQEAFSHD